MKSKALILCILFSIFIYIHFYINFKLKPRNDTSPNVQAKVYNTNAKWMFNGNIMQYSSYLIVKNATNAWFECMVAIERPGKEALKTETDFLGVVKLIDINELIKIRPQTVYRSYSKNTLKVIIPFNDAMSYKNIAVAVLLKGKDGKFGYYTTKYKDHDHYMVNYQKADVIEVKQRKIQSIGLCINYIFNFVNATMLFIKMQRRFGVSEIVMYDATKNFKMKQHINDKLESIGAGIEVNVLEYNLNAGSICIKQYIWFDRLTNSHSRQEYLSKCKLFVKNEMYLMRKRRHEDISNNDCYIRLKYKYEFVGLYDIDEIIFPRVLPVNTSASKGSKLASIATCNTNETSSNAAMCNIDPFSMSLYDYVKQVIKSNGYEPHQISGVNFRHTAYLIPNELHKFLIANIKSIIEKIQLNDNQADRNITTKLNKNSIQFPIKIKIYQHTFEIEQNDVDYLKHLIQLENGLECLFKAHLANIHKTTLVQWNFLRYMYHITQPNQRFGKSVYYTDNVDMLFVHWAQHRKARNIDGNHVNGEFLAHFRYNFRTSYSRKSTTSIRNVNFDLEYLAYLLKTFSLYCPNVK